jgi:hypothetical protein
MSNSNYYSSAGEIFGERSVGGASLDYMPDALGSVTVVNDGTTVNTATYTPYELGISQGEILYRSRPAADREEELRTSWFESNPAGALIAILRRHHGELQFARTSGGKKVASLSLQTMQRTLRRPKCGGPECLRFMRVVGKGIFGGRIHFKDSVYESIVGSWRPRLADQASSPAAANDLLHRAFLGRPTIVPKAPRWLPRIRVVSQL